MQIAIVARDEFEDGIGEDFTRIFDELGVGLVKVDGNVKNLERVCAECDGLLVPGDVNDTPPKYYGEKPIVGKNYEVDDFAFDRRVIEIFQRENKPILGICGGSQSVAVYFGGSLNQYIEGHDLPLEERHNISIEPGSFLGKTYGATNLSVNSLHHQSVKTPPEGFMVAAYADDGTIEGIQRDNIIMVQWHPEKMNDVAFFRAWIEGL